MSARLPINLGAPTIVPAGAAVGPFSAFGQAWSGAAGVGFNFANSRWIGQRFFRGAGNLNNQTIWCFNNAAASGWRYILSNTASSNLFFSGASLAIPLMYLGLNHVLFGLDSGGALWVSVNGSTGATFAAPGAYTAGGASAKTAVGADVTSSNFASTQTRIFQNYILDGVSLTPAEMGAITRDKSSLDRWHAGPLLRNHPNLTWFLNWEDWDGASATFAGTGGGAITLTRAGGGGGRNVFPARARYRIPQRSIGGSDVYQYYENGVYNHRSFSFPQFATNAVDTTNGPFALSVGVYGKNLGIVGNAGVGVNSSATGNLAGNNVGAELSVFSQLEMLDVPGIGAGTKTITLTESIQSIILATGEIQPNASPQFVEVPLGASLTWVDQYATAPADLQLWVSDSLLEQIDGMTDSTGIKGPFYQSVPPLQRAAAAPRATSSICLGGDTFFNEISTAPKRAALVAAIKRACRGTVTNWVRVQMCTNDFGFNTYLLQTSFQADLAAFFALLFAAGITGLKLQLFGTTDRLGGGTPNASGWVLADFRNSQSTAVTTFANANCTYVDASTAVSPANRPILHYTTAGQLEYSNFATANTPP